MQTQLLPSEQVSGRRETGDDATVIFFLFNTERYLPSRILAVSRLSLLATLQLMYYVS